MQRMRWKSNEFLFDSSDFDFKSSFASCPCSDYVQFLSFEILFITTKRAILAMVRPGEEKKFWEKPQYGQSKWEKGIWILT